MKRPYTIDGVDNWYDDGWPEPTYQSPHAKTAYDGLLETFFVESAPTFIERFFDAVADLLASTPPFSWLNGALGGPVGGND